MWVRSYHGNHEDAKRLVFENNAAFIELHETSFDQVSLSEVVSEQNRKVPFGGVKERDIVISMDLWECSNTPRSLGLLYADIAQYMHERRNVNFEIIIVHTDFMEGVIIEDRIRRKLEVLEQTEIDLVFA